jgi:GTP cyclohydrolase II
LGEDAQIARERAVGELRAGRPLLIQDGLIQDGSGATLIAALDGVAPSVLSAFTDMADASLILSPHRARVLGLQTDQAVASPLAGLDQGSAWRLACSARHAPPPVWRAALPAEEAAVALCKQALFLPAALAAPAAPGAALPASLFRLELSAARAADAPRLHELELVSSAEAPLAGGVAARFLVFRGGPTPRDQVAVIVGDPDPAQPVLVRVHSACLTGDLFGSMKCDCGDQLRGAMDRLAAEGGGVLLYLDQEGRGIGIGNKMRAYALQQESMDTIEADAVLGFSPDERRFEYAASILLKLGYRKIVLLTNNPEKIGALMRAGLDVVGRRPLFGAVTVHNRGYLATKAARADHDLEALLTPPAAGASS